MNAVVFDLDDTLYPERAYAFSGFAAVARAFETQFGDPTKTATTLERLFDTEHRRRAFNALLAERGIPESPDLIRAMIETFRAHQPAISPFVDADDALARLSARCPLGIITDGPRIQQSAKLAALSLADRVGAIIMTDELGPEFAKPHPRAFEIMAERLGAAHHECVYVADNPAKDFVAPNALGWLTLRIVRPEGIYRDAPTAEGGAPRNVIKSLDEIDAALG